MSMLPRIVVAAFEADIFGGLVGADAVEKSGKGHAGPLADITAFDTDMPRNLGLMRQGVERILGPGLLVFEAIFAGFSCRNFRCF